MALPRSSSAQSFLTLEFQPHSQTSHRSHRRQEPARHKNPFQLFLQDQLLCSHCSRHRLIELARK